MDSSATTHVIATMIATNQNGYDKAGLKVDFPIKGTNKPSITVTSPNGGETLTLGSTYEVKNTYDNQIQPMIGYALYKGSTKLGHLVGTPIISDQNFKWNVGQYQEFNSKEVKTAAPGSDYTIGLYTPGNSQLDFSDGPFSIVKDAGKAAITVLSPNGGETFVQGGMNKISWSGGKNKVQIGVVKADFNPASALILGWISLGGSPNASINWDAKTVCDLIGTTCWPILSLSPGPFKIILVSEDIIGNYCTWSSAGGCNMDVSDRPFSIVKDAGKVIIKEQVKCVFENSDKVQKCYTDDGKFGCSGTEVCIADVYGEKGTKLSWISPSCTSDKKLRLTIIDGENEYAEFKCTSTDSPITVFIPNGGEVWQKGTTKTIKWNSAKDVSKIYIKLRKGNDTYPGPEGVITDVIPNNGYYSWKIPTTLPDGSDYAVLVINANPIDQFDVSDKPFSIVSSLPKAMNADLKANGVVDINDLLFLLSIWGPCQTTGTQTACLGDFNSDGLVNAPDLDILMALWGTNGIFYPARVDVNGDGTVGILDLDLILVNWASCYTPSPDGYCLGDINLDAVVNNTDLKLLLAFWTEGSAPAASTIQIPR